MKPTKILPYIVIVDDHQSRQVFSFRTERQAKKFFNDVQIGTHYKVSIFVSLLKGKRGGK